MSRRNKNGKVVCNVSLACVFGKGVDKSRPVVTYKNPVDKLTSTISWPTLFGNYCYFCDKKTMASLGFRITIPGRSKKERCFRVS